MADGSKTARPAAAAQWTQATPAGYMPGFGNDFETEALPGALPRRPELAAAHGLRPLCRAAVGLALHGAARHQRALLALPHPPVGAARARSSARRRCRYWKTAPSHGRARPADRPAALEPGADPEGEADLPHRHAHHDHGRRRQHAGRHGRAHLSRHAVDGGRLLLQRRRRAADRAAAGLAALLHRVRQRSRWSPARSASSRAASSSRSS